MKALTVYDDTQVITPQAPAHSGGKTNASRSYSAVFKGEREKKAHDIQQRSRGFDCVFNFIKVIDGRDLYQVTETKI